MTSSNINKIVQSNVNLKPWMLSKNTSEIVNTCIQRLYKQMPNQFRKEKPIKVASPREENKGPLRVFKSQETQDPLMVVPVRKTIKAKQRTEKPIITTLKASSLNNVQIASKFAGVNLTASRRTLKSPNYKIYKARRFGSSASSSRSSLLRRYEERRRHRQNYPAQINYLIRSFHTNKLEPTYARYLMPARNQQVESRLGSIPDAVKFSSSIQSDLMTVDSTTRSRLNISVKPSKKIKLNQAEKKRKEDLLSPSMQIKYRELQLRDAPVKTVKQMHEKGVRKIRMSPEEREFSTDNFGRIPQMKHPKPSNELFTAQHDRTQTELHEKHRRNRMLKLGLIRPSTQPDDAEVEESSTPPTTTPASNTTNKAPPQNEVKAAAKEPHEANVGPVQNALTPRKVHKMRNPQLEDISNVNPPSSSSSLQSTPPAPPPLHKTGASQASQKVPKFETPLRKYLLEEKKAINLKESSQPPPSPPSSPLKEHKGNTALASPSTSTKRSSSTSSSASTPKSPIAMLRAQMPKNNYQAYRYNRADFFSTKKY